MKTKTKVNEEGVKKNAGRSDKYSRRKLTLE